MSQYNNIIKSEIKTKGHEGCICNDLMFCTHSCSHRSYCNRILEMKQINDVSCET